MKMYKIYLYFWNEDNIIVKYCLNENMAKKYREKFKYFGDDEIIIEECNMNFFLGILNYIKYII